ncbi:MAG: hypothetical protein NVSMB51_15430 [Solirubrobacteraceae bacterium]
MRVELLGKSECCLCDDAREVLERMRDELGFELYERDITSDDSLHREYFERIPVVLVEGRELMNFHVDELALREHLNHLASGR